MKTLKLYRVHVTMYTDTRMGADNPSFYIGNTQTSLEGCKKVIVSYFKKKNKKIEDFEIKNNNWSKDFRPEIISIQTETINL